jgi:hypothetical protein
MRLRIICSKRKNLAHVLQNISHTVGKDVGMHFTEKSNLLTFTERRRNPRNCAPLTVVIGNTPYAIENWSYSGMKIANYYGVLQPPAKTKIKILVPTAGSGALFQTFIKTIRYSPFDVSLSIEFKSLALAAKKTLSRYFQEQYIYNSLVSENLNNS